MEAAASGESPRDQESGPTVYLLVGLTGSGKTTYARRRLESAGAVRLSVDERVHARHGRYGVDYPERDYFSLEAVVVAEVREELVDLVAAGRDAVLDHGLCSASGCGGNRRSRRVRSASRCGPAHPWATGGG
ncbi:MULTISPECIES: AAA family ATPase [unclassified Streptomyces]|uniref:AAA family ATPase n=1 Tax=unclassified Streptomyces TaxID=2593676 RepID=UPI002DDB3F03|nr:AAA family ATPase [Streptomyces sp. NBC_01788]